MPPFTASGPGYAVIYVPLSVPDLAAVMAALQHTQAEDVLQRITAAWRQLERVRSHG